MLLPNLDVTKQSVANSTSEFTPSTSWLNVGQTIVDEVTGEVKFISIGGIPMDSLKAPVGGLQKELHAAVMELIASMQWGETKSLKLEVEVRKVRDPNAPKEAKPSRLKPLF